MPRFFVDIEARFAQVQDALNQITRNTERASKQMSSAFNGVKQSLAALGVGVGVGAFGRELVRSTIEAEKSAARLDAVLKQTGGTVGITRRELDELAESMEGAFGIDDDQIRNAQATLIKFGNIQGDVFREGLKLSADLAAHMGTDITSAAQLVGKALQSPTQGLKGLEQQIGQIAPETEKLINNLVRQGKTIEAQREVLRLFNDSIGGTARLMNDGLNKALNDVTNSWDGFLKALGKTEGPMKIVREAFGGLAITLNFLKGLMEKPTDAELMSKLVDGIKAIDREMGKLNARQAELNSKQSLGHAEAVERLQNEGKINLLLEKRSKLFSEHNALERFKHDEALAEAEARAAGVPPKAGGKAKESEEEKAFKRALESIQRQIDALKGISVEEQVLKDIRAGAYIERDAAELRHLLNLARQVDRIKAVQEAQKLGAKSEEEYLLAQQAAIEAADELRRDAALRSKKEREELEKLRDTAQATSDALMGIGPGAGDGSLGFVRGFPATDMAVELGVVVEEVKDKTDELAKAANDLGFTFTSAFEDAIVEGEKFSEVLKGLEKDVARIILRMTVTKPLGEGLAGLISEGLKGIFSGDGGGQVVVPSSPDGFAEGGSVIGGRRILVGEKGPELFVPSTSGSIVPNHALGGVTINNGDIIISGNGVTTADVRAALAASERRTIEAVRELNRR